MRHKHPNPDKLPIDPASGKPIRRVTTAWLNDRDPRRLGLPPTSHHRVSPSGKRHDTAVIRRNQYVEQVAAELAKLKGPQVLFEIVQRLGIPREAFRKALGEIDHPFVITQIAPGHRRGRPFLIELKK